ncbi:hypothetical protein N0V88_004881 [Collariella sp. IMI 366227]|nr:hypothetical protein N0V88_004881 [Collariella sp. IMI 366227]
MSTESRKRPAETDDDGSHAKRLRTESSHLILSLGQLGASQFASAAATTDDLANKGLKRGIALALQKVGFESAAPDAMESFAVMAEASASDISSLVETVKRHSNAARRSYPVPRDFEQSLKRFNLTTSLLQPHKKPPIPRPKRLPTWEPLPANDPLDADLPILGDELDGAPEKATKDVDAVTVSDDWGAFNPDSQTLDGSQTQPQQPQRPLAPDEIPHGDPKKMREAAAKEAKAGEGALRRLMRASKIAKQKEVWSSAQRQPARRDRYNLWEAAMRELIEDDTRSKGKEFAPTLIGDKGRFEIADHSMIVNTEKGSYRQDVPRAGARKAAAAQGVAGKG